MNNKLRKTASAATTPPRHRVPAHRTAGMLVSMLLLLSWGTATLSAQTIVANDADAEHFTGRPIFSHGINYAGTVMYDGEEIPWFIFNDYYCFGKLVFKNEREMKRYYRIANNIKKVYPLAVEIQHEVQTHINHMDSLPDKEAKDRYMSDMEKYLKKKYTPRMKELTFTQGKLLIKLIDRQCNQTSYALIKTYMGKFKAGVYNAFATLFGASLKKEYDPEVDDRLTERCILLIESGQM